jgi:DNA-binding NarL/FixJ family response regulator
MMISVLIAEDQSMVRAGFRALIEAEPDLTVGGEAANGREVVELALARKPDVVLMDIRMPEMDGLEAARRISAEPSLAASHILVLTTFELDEYVFGALRAGASGFLLKGGAPADLLAAIRIVAAGEALLAPSVTRRLIETYAKGSPAEPPDVPGLDELTAREREVLVLVAEGLTNAEIAERLVLSPLTAKTHVSRILTKLGARDRVQLVVIAHQSGIAGSELA